MAHPGSKNPPGGTRRPNSGVGYQYGREGFPEYSATEYAPSVVDAPYQDEERGPFDEPTRVYLPDDERYQQAQYAEAYQTEVEAAYPGQPHAGYQGQVPYNPHQAYAPYPNAPGAMPRPSSGAHRVHGGTGPQHLPPQSQSLAIVEATANRVVVVYPTAVQPPSPELIMVQRPDTATADQYRMLRFKLVDRAAAQVIAVTGPTRGVGTSVTAANLALSLAEAGRARVVLVDCDVRKGRQGIIFGIESDAGLTVELERRHANPDVAVRVVAVAAAMAILPAGHDVPNPTAMLGSDVMARFLEDLRFMYDHVVLDVAPVLERSDAAAIHNLVDCFLLVGMSGVTTTDELEKTEEKLPRKKVAGVVLNSLPKEPKGLMRRIAHLMSAGKRRRKYLRRGKRG